LVQTRAVDLKLRLDTLDKKMKKTQNYIEERYKKIEKYEQNNLTFEKEKEEIRERFSEVATKMKKYSDAEGKLRNMRQSFSSELQSLKDELNSERNKSSQYKQKF
jgi:chromosome segregation ATPase